MTLKKLSRSPKHYTPISMMYLCNFDQKISTRCSEGMQITFYSGWGILVSFWLEEVMLYELASVPIFQTYTVSFEI